jgi:hypothetical protein
MVLTNSPVASAATTYTFAFPTARVFSPLLMSLPLQLFAYYALTCAAATSTNPATCER